MFSERSFSFRGLRVDALGKDEDGRERYAIWPPPGYEPLRPLVFSIAWQQAPETALVLNVIDYALRRAVVAIGDIEPQWSEVYQSLD